MLRPLPEDPNTITVNWYHQYQQVLVWEDETEVFPWCLRWIVTDRDQNIVWQHQETFQWVSHALTRAGVISYVVETDERLVQPNLGVPSDRAAFDELVRKLLGFTTARRESTALLHRVSR